MEVLKQGVVRRLCVRDGQRPQQRLKWPEIPRVHGVVAHDQKPWYRHGSAVHASLVERHDAAPSDDRRKRRVDREPRGSRSGGELAAGRGIITVFATGARSNLRHGRQPRATNRSTRAASSIAERAEFLSAGAMLPLPPIPASMDCAFPRGSATPLTAASNADRSYPGGAASTVSRHRSGSLPALGPSPDAAFGLISSK